MATRARGVVVGLLAAVTAVCAISPSGAQPPAAVLEYRDKEGQYTVRATEISRVRRLDPEGEGQWSLRLAVSVESRKPALGASWSPLKEAVDDTGASLLPPTAGGERPVFFSGGMMGRPMPSSFTLLVPDEKATRIARVEGKVTLAVSTGQEEIRFDQPLQAKDEVQEKAGRKMTLRSLKQDGRHVTAEVRMESTGAPAAVGAPGMGGLGGPMYMGMGPQNGFALVGADGTEKNANGLNGRGEDRAMVWRIEWQGLPEGFVPKSLVVRFVAGQKTEELPFVLQDIPLP